MKEINLKARESMLSAAKLGKYREAYDTGVKLLRLALELNEKRKKLGLKEKTVEEYLDSMSKQK